VTATAAVDRSVRLSCERCATVHRVRDFQALKPGMSASCITCAAPFLVVAMPVLLPDGTPHTEANEPVGLDQPLQLAEQQTAIQADGGCAHTYTATFYGTGGSLFGIHLVNTLLTLVTLGFYYYWAKVKVRCYFFNQTEFAGDRFSYHGNARELMNGALKATVVFALPYYGLSHIGPFIESSVAVNIGLQIAASLLLLFFIPVAIVGARRYRLTRTAWRGIRFSFQGKAWDFIKLWLSGYALTGLSLGLYYPYFSTKKHAFLTEHSYFGNEPFRFSGNGAQLFRPFLTMYLIAATSFLLVSLAAYAVVGSFVAERLKGSGGLGSLIVIMSTVIVSLIVGWLLFRLLWLPYSVTEQRYFWEQTSIGPASFSLSISTWPYVKLKLVNILLGVGTLGLAWPWITIRNIRFVTDRLVLTGVDNFDEVVQMYDAAPPIGEGLDGFLDTGFDLG
jgi:uncharacterized membrane protein YjgN (DUF898 family)